jgi:GNAT superfamily N-acetyltransferase
MIDELQIIEVLTNEEWQCAGEVLQVLRPQLNINDFVARRDTLTGDGYKFVALVSGNKYLSVASYTISPHTMYGRELLVHDMATAVEESGKGYGSRVLEYLAEVAEKTKCWRIFVHTKNTKGFYLRNGFDEYSTGLVKIFNR